MLKNVAIGFFILRFLCCVVALALSVTLIKSYQIGSPPTTLKYGSFTGGFGMIASAVGLAALFVEAIPMVVIAGLEAVTTLLLLAAGIAFAIGMRGSTCDANNRDIAKAQATLDNDLINQGRTTFNGQPAYGIGIPEADSSSVYEQRLLDNCKKATADEIFQFIAFAFGVGTIVLCYLFMRNGRPSKSTTYV